MSESTLVQWLREARKVMAFCGAGVSAESGVPTFRGAGGLWEGRPVTVVATPEGFRKDPQRVWRFYAQRLESLPTVHPNPAHQALAEMERRYERCLTVTQNVDDLHERAGSRELVKLHGSLRETRCTRCDEVRRITEPITVAAIEEGNLPHCACGGLLRPNVVWFGEYLNPLHMERTYDFFDCDAAPSEQLVLIIGTSGVVSAGYGITDLARMAGARTVEINPEPAFGNSVDLTLAEPAGALLGRVWPQVFNG